MLRLSLLLFICVLLSSAAHRSSASHRGHRVKRETKVKRHTKQLSPEPASTILADVSVVDVVTGRILPHRDILITGDRISDIRPAAVRGTRERYVIPGLQDMHVHLWNENAPVSLYVANGITTVRDMGGDLKALRRLQARIAAGETIGPRIYLSGAAVSNRPAAANCPIPLRLIQTPFEARRAFDSYYDQRVDFIRIVDMDARSFEALAERSRHDGIPFAGFVPDSVPARAAAEDRMTTMEHLSGIALACSSKQEELRAKRIRAANDCAALRAIDAEIMASYDPVAAASLWDLFRRYGAWQTPSLTWWKRAEITSVQDATRAAVVRDMEKPAQDTTPAAVVGDMEKLAQDATRVALVPDPETYFDFAAKLTREMARGGAPILAGTDSGEPGTDPGVELHRELELLAGAGLSPIEALRTATLEPARLERRSDLGQVKTNFIADLVVLRANPLTDIRNTRAIEEVIVRGKRLDRTQLDELLKTRGD